MYLKRVGVQLSALLNVVLGGYANQTFSARNYDWKKRGLPHLVPIIDLVLGEGHCLHDWVTWTLLRDTLVRLGKTQ